MFPTCAFIKNALGQAERYDPVYTNSREVFQHIIRHMSTGTTGSRLALRLAGMTVVGVW
jgi:hypothetical protein